MTKHGKIKYITLAAVLSALIVVLSFLPIKAFVEITLTIIPISIGIIIGGYKMGLILGTIFGLISYVQCFGYKYNIARKHFKKRFGT